MELMKEDRNDVRRGLTLLPLKQSDFEICKYDIYVLSTLNNHIRNKSCQLSNHYSHNIYHVISFEKVKKHILWEAAAQPHKHSVLFRVNKML